MLRKPWSHWLTLFQGSEAEHNKLTCGVKTTTPFLPLREGDVRLDLPPSFTSDYRQRKTAGGSEKQC